jgi:hypothetical protein
MLRRFHAPHRVHAVERSSKSPRSKIPNPKFQIPMTKLKGEARTRPNLRKHFARSAFGLRCVRASLSHSASQITRSSEIPTTARSKSLIPGSNHKQISMIKPKRREDASHSQSFAKYRRNEFAFCTKRFQRAAVLRRFQHTASLSHC